MGRKRPHGDYADFFNVESRQWNNEGVKEGLEQKERMEGGRDGGREGVKVGREGREKESSRKRAEN